VAHYFFDLKAKQDKPPEIIRPIQLIHIGIVQEPMTADHENIILKK